MNSKMSQGVRISLVSFLICIQAASADGRKIAITLRNGQELRGELLSAREKSLVITIGNNISDQELMDHPELVAAVPQQDIQKVTVQGKSHVLGGMCIGLLLGTVGGGIIGNSQGYDNEPIAEIIVKPMVVAGSALTFGLLGLLVGTLIGAGSSRGHEEIDTESLQDLFYFSQYARYQNDEPEFLKTVGR
jgi:hypothetical protein